MEQLIIFVVVGVILLIQWLVKGAGQFTKGAPPNRDSEQERLRRFLEALGQDPGNPPVRQAPPPVARPSVTPPAMPRGGSLRTPPLPPPLRVELPKQNAWFEEEKSAEPASRGNREELSPAVQAALRKLESGGGFHGETEEASPWDPKPKKSAARRLEAGAPTLRQLLSTQAGLREVFIAQEVLGTPVSLREKSLNLF